MRGETPKTRTKALALEQIKQITPKRRVSHHSLSSSRNNQRDLNSKVMPQLAELI